MATLQPSDAHFEIFNSLWQILARDLETSCGIYSTCTSNKYLALILRIEIQKIIPLDHPLTKSKSASQTTLLIDRKECSEFAMLQLRISKCCQSCCHPNAAISPEGCSTSLDPSIFCIDLNGIFGEIVLYIAPFLAHHVDMRLHSYAPTRLTTSGWRCYNQ